MSNATNESLYAGVTSGHECYARNFMKYVLARELDPVERGASQVLGQRSQDTGSMRELLVELVKLDTFRARISDPP